MLIHVVTFRWNDSGTEGRVTALAAALRELPSVIPELRSYRLGSDLGLRDGNADFAVVAELDDAAGLETYLDHPRHRAVIEQHVAPMVDVRTAVQFSA